MSDLIDRQAAIDALKAIRFGLWEIDIPSPTVPEYIEHHEQIQNMMGVVGNWIDRLSAFPAAEPERKGKWIDDGRRYGNDNDSAIWECDQCRHTVWAYLKDPDKWNYCPYCGAKMDEVVE